MGSPLTHTLVIGQIPFSKAVCVTVIGQIAFSKAVCVTVIGQIAFSKAVCVTVIGSPLQPTASGTPGARGVAAPSHVTEAGRSGRACAKARPSPGNSARARGRKSASAVTSVAQVTQRIIEL